MKYIKLLLLILVNTGIFCVNTIITPDYFLTRKIIINHFYDCSYWSNHYNYPEDTYEKIFYMTLTINKCELKNHNNFLFKHINDDIKVNFFSPGSGISPVVDVEVIDTLNKLYKTNNNKEQ